MYTYKLQLQIKHTPEVFVIPEKEMYVPIPLVYKFDIYTVSIVPLF